MSGTHLALKTSLKKREHSGFKNRNKNEFSTGKTWPSMSEEQHPPEQQQDFPLSGQGRTRGTGEAAEGRGSCQLQRGGDPDMYHTPEKSMELHLLPLLILPGQLLCYALLTAEA